MATTYVQADRPMTVTTPLGKDALLLVGFTGQEALSQLFSFQLDLLAENRKEVAFDKLLGQKVTITLALPGEKGRYFNGICNRISQGLRDHTFTAYRVEVVPQFWLLARRAQSRIFQHLSVPDILKKVLEGIDVAFELQGTFYPRDFCVQYRESDFNFASRLMEEEGIYYFFKHTADGHKLVLANTPQSHPELPEQSKVIFEELEGGEREDMRVFSWEKVQELRPGKYTLWDHCFELPDKHLEAEKNILESVQAGKVNHKLKVGGNEVLEIYDYPGEYAQRFDGVDKGGGDRASDLQKIFQDNERTVGIRIQQEAVPGLVIHGAGNCRQFVAGHKFTLDRHFNADGQYLLTGVVHSGRLEGDYRSGEATDFVYQNSFTCIPFALPFRPQRLTPKPVVQGTQTAIVVGPPGEEIFTDKYGRVKVQFHWDREGKGDADSSCWIRVSTLWAGNRWGMIHIPRVGQEVVVDFLEGDPDQPIIIGSVYNAATMPPYKLGDEKTKSGIKSDSSPHKPGFNEIRFEDKKEEEQVFIHAEKDFDLRIKHDRREWVDRDRHLIVNRDKREQIGRDEHILVKRDLVEQADRDHHLKVGGKEAIEVTGSHSFKVVGDVAEEFKKNHSEQVGMSYYLKGGMTVVIEAGLQLTLKVGGNFIDINPAGVFIQGTMVMINSGGAAGSGVAGMLVPPTAPAEAEIADNADPGDKAPTYKYQRANLPPLQALALDAPSHDPNSEENKEKTHWIEAQMVDEAGKPVPGVRCRVTLPDGTTIDEGTTNEEGVYRASNFDPAGSCKITFPDLDQDAWE